MLIAKILLFQIHNLLKELDTRFSGFRVGIGPGIEMDQRP